MKVVFASHGSLGDLVPFLEIGKVLVADGHHVVVATHAAHRGAVEAAGLRLYPMRPDRPRDASFHARYLAPRSGPAFAFRSYLGPAIADSDADLMAACDGADVLVSVTLALAAPLVAARTKIPWVSAVFQPAMLYSAYDPPKLPMVPFVNGWTSYNRRILSWAKKGVEPWATHLRAYRRAEGLGEYPDHPAFGGQHSLRRVLALYSPLFGTLAPDAPPQAVQTGQVLQTGGPRLDPAIDAFLDAGPPPLVFTLGSASAHAARRFFTDAVTLTRSLSQRGLFLVGRADNAAGLRLGADHHVAVTAPYHKVFPRAALTVHQGGIGTIALSISAGTKMVLVPFAHDQPDNAVRAERAGLAKVIPRWRFSGRCTFAIDAALNDGALAQRLAAAADTINAEQGAIRAAAEICRAAQDRTIFLSNALKVPLPSRMERS